MQDKKITIIGLGLIGGSLARVLRKQAGISDITAVNRSSESLNQAIKDGIISRGFHEINDYVYNSDVIFICTPVKRSIEYIGALAGKVKPGCIVTDVGSTKEEITAYVNSLQDSPCFIGGHPMTGAEKAGYSSSFDHLFENTYYILSPCKTTTDAAMNCMAELVKMFGAIPVILDACEHDKIAGTISHIPHIIASALVNMVRECDSPDGKMKMLAAGGFKDITRIASSSPEIWESVIMSNKQHVKEILDYYIDMLDTFRNYVAASDSKNIYDFFESARNFRNTFANKK